jgi:hypothetical protein
LEVIKFHDLSHVKVSIKSNSRNATRKICKFAKFKWIMFIFGPVSLFIRNKCFHDFSLIFLERTSLCFIIFIMRNCLFVIQTWTQCRNSLNSSKYSTNDLVSALNVWLAPKLIGDNTNWFNPIIHRLITAIAFVIIVMLLWHKLNWLLILIILAGVSVYIHVRFDSSSKLYHYLIGWINIILAHHHHHHFHWYW